MRGVKALKHKELGGREKNRWGHPKTDEKKGQRSAATVNVRGGSGIKRKYGRQRGGRGNFYTIL